MKPKKPAPTDTGHPLATGTGHVLQPEADPAAIAASAPLLDESMATMQTQPVSEDSAIGIETPSPDLLNDSMSTMQTQPTD